MKERLATFMCAGSIIAIVAFLAGLTVEQESWNDRLNAPSQSAEQPLPAPTVAATEGLAVVIAITPTREATQRPTETSVPFPTSTQMPPCLEGLATPGRLCKAIANTPPPEIATKIVVYPGTEEAILGVIYQYPTEVPE